MHTCTSSSGAHCNSTKIHFAGCLPQNVCIYGRPVEVLKLEPLQVESHIPKLVHRCIHTKGSHIHSIKGCQSILGEVCIVVVLQSCFVIVGEGVCALQVQDKMQSIVSLGQSNTLMSLNTSLALYETILHPKVGKFNNNVLTTYTTNVTEAHNCM